MKRVDGVWVPVSTKEDPVALGGTPFGMTNKNSAAPIPWRCRPAQGWADAERAPAAEQG
jgi:hypothetical protein